MNADPSPVQQQYLDYMAKHLVSHQRLPSMLEMASHFGVAVNASNDVVKALTKKGKLIRHRAAKGRTSYRLADFHVVLEPMPGGRGHE